MCSIGISAASLNASNKFLLPDAEEPSFALGVLIESLLSEIDIRECYSNLNHKHVRNYIGSQRRGHTV